MNSAELKDKLIADFYANEARINGEGKTAFHQTRKAALQSFEHLGFPTIKHEEWKYSNVKELIKQQFEFGAKTDFGQNEVNELSIPDLEGNILYFVNGVYNPELSALISPKDSFLIMSFGEAIKNSPALLEKHFASYAKYDSEGFIALNTAFAADGVVIEVPANKVVEEPIILRFISDSRLQNAGSQPRNLIVMGKNAEAKVTESFRTIGEFASFTNIVTEIVLDENANLQYYKVQNDSDKSYHIGTTQVSQNRNSHFYGVTVTLDGGFVRNNLNIVLGEHCEAFMYGLYFPNGNQHIDNHTLADHAMPNSYSNELYKGILKDKATGVFNGKIFVREDAQKTNAYQSCRNVVLSDEASMNTKPQLEIYADDVKCSHGTTTGKLNEEALFYMRSRGIPKAEAMTLLMYAFCEDVISQIKIEPIRNYLSGLIAKKLAE